jgi:P4 family phage/plasmid primase-like protien
MTDNETMHPGAAFLSSAFGSSTEHRVFLCSLLNADAQPEAVNERSIATREVDLIERFAERWDRAGRGLYFCVSTLKPNKRRRSKDAVAELTCLFADIDFKNIAASPDDVRRIVGQLMCLPSIVNFSGNGLHLFWLFKEALEATPETVAEVERLLRLLADHVGGDPAVAEVSRLLRLPGSHNSKFGAWTEVITESDRPIRYTLDDLAEWLEIVSPVIRRRAPEKGNGHDSNPWLEVAAKYGFKPPLDVEERLAAMQFQGPGDAAIHPTQVSVSAALLTRGTPVDEVVAMLLEATRAAAGPFGSNWNWVREERAIRALCETWIAKHPEIVTQPRTEAGGETGEDPEPGDASATDQPPGDASTADEPQASADAQATEPPKAQPSTKKHKRKTGRATLAMAIADGAIKKTRLAAGDLLLTDGELYVYGEGVWMIATPAYEQRLRVLIQEGAEALGEGADSKLVSAAWRRLLEHPGLYYEHVAWDATGKVALANGVLDLRTREFTSWSPQHFLRRKLAGTYDPQAAAPQFAKFLARLFANQDPQTWTELTALLQEFAGAALCTRLLRREQRRALFLVGPSRTGKSELARLFGHLIGTPVASPSVGQLGERFGLASLFDAVAWIRDDAVNEGDRLDPQKFKTVVTGEPIDIERKNRPAVRVALAMPVILTANSLPASRDASDAVFNRALVVDLTNVIDEESAVTVHKQLNIPPGMWLADFLFEREGPGILNWALAGLERLLVRGHYDIPAAVAASLQRFKDESNAVAEFARTMLEESPTTKIDRADLLCAFHGWLKEEVGDDAKLHGARWLIPKLRTACAWGSERKIMGTRYFCGVKLSNEGLKFWSRQADEASRTGRGSKGASSVPGNVNQSWTPRDQEEPDGELPF